MRIEPADETFPAAARRCDFSFEVRAVAVPPFTGPGLGAVEPVAPHHKSYDSDFRQLLRRAKARGRALFVARDGERMLGFIALSRAWNNYAEVDDFAVDVAARRFGVGRLLMDRAVAWAREQNLPGLRLETQSNNVPACRFYERYGFVLGGYDQHLYTALPAEDAPVRPETALYWYLFLSPIDRA